jgi:quercetin dioxygenase-like cupin family protein
MTLPLVEEAVRLEEELERTRAFLVENGSVEPQPVGSVEGKEAAGSCALKPLVVGDNIMVLEVRMLAGFSLPEHAHEGMESAMYVVSGTMRWDVAGTPCVARAGDAAYHPAGVPHTTLCLEDALFVEIKSPPRKVW